MKVIKDKILENVSESEILSIAFDSRKKILASCAFEESVLVKKYPYMKLIKKITHRSKRIQNLDTNFNSDDCAVNLCADNDSKGSIIKGPILTASKLLFSEKQSLLIIIYANGDLLVYNTVNWKKETEFNFNTEIVSIQLIDDENTLFLYTADWKLNFIDIKSWKIVDTKTIDSVNSGKAIITKDKSKLYLISDKKRVTAIDLNSLEEIMRLKAHKSGINMIALSPNEEILTTCGNDGKITLINTNTGEKIETLLGHQDEIHSILFGPNGKFLISSSEDYAVKFWNLENFKNFLTLDNVPTAFDMNINDNLLIMGNVEGSINIYRIIGINTLKNQNPKVEDRKKKNSTFDKKYSRNKSNGNQKFNKKNTNKKKY
jgi:WD40 repeat protein